MKTKKKSLFTVVLTWNRKDLAIRCLTSLKKSQTKDFNHKIIVVDNNSKDDTVSAIKKKFPTVTVLQNKENLGWTGGNNVGVKYALRHGADYIFFLNNDATVTPDTLNLLVKTMDKNPSVGLCSPKIYQLGKQKIITNAGNFITDNFACISIGSGKKDIGQYNHVFKTDFIAGAGCVRKEVFKKIGFFNNDFFLYFEDADFSMRAKRAGFTCAFVQKAILYHMGTETIKNNSPVHTYYNARNYLLFAEKYAPFWVRVKVILISLRLLIRQYKHTLPQRKYYYLGILDYALRRFGNRHIT